MKFDLILDTVVCIGSGPSLSEYQINKVRESCIPTIAVNNAYFEANWAEYMFAADAKWWKHYYDDVMKIKDRTGTKLYTLEGVLKQVEKRKPYCRNNIEEVPFEREPGLGIDRLCHGGNSGYLAVNLAFLMGAKKIILVGYDHQHTNNKSHFHGDHDPKIFNRNADYTELWVDRFAQLSKDLNDHGIDLVNCSTETAIDSCRKGTLRQELVSC